MTRVLLISANSDVAKACARVYAEHGFDLVLASRNITETELLAKDIQIRYQRKVECLFLDIQDTSSHQGFFDKVIETGDLSGVLCFTGYLGDQAASQKNTAELIKITESNYLGIASLLEIIAAYLEQRKEGFIVALSSVAGDRGRKSNYHYGAAKAALSTFLSGLRNRLSESNINVLTVKPGFMNTRMTSELELPPLLTAEPEDVAFAIYKAQQKKRHVIYVKGIWFFIMLIIKHIPESIFRKTNL